MRERKKMTDKVVPSGSLDSRTRTPPLVCNICTLTQCEVHKWREVLQDVTFGDLDAVNTQT